MKTFELISHHLCPYVQRARIVLEEKSVPHTLRFIDLADKPDWFLAISPLGKVPVLRVDGEALFESAAIAEYLDEITWGRLHPGDAFERARHRAWTAFASSTLDNIAALYNAPEPSAFERHRQALADKLGQLESTLGGGPYFAGRRFSLVDAAFAPVFRYFDVIEGAGGPRFLDATPAVRAWHAALAARPSVKAAAVPDYRERLLTFFAGRRSHLSALLEPSRAA